MESILLLDIPDFNTKERIEDSVLSKLRVSFYVRLLSIFLFPLFNTSYLVHLLWLFIEDSIDTRVTELSLFYKIKDYIPSSMGWWDIIDKLSFLQYTPRIKNFYQKIDKIVDLISYSVFIYYIFMNNLFTKEIRAWFIFFFVYRLIGVLIFYYTTYYKVLIIFPDLIKEFGIYLLFTQCTTFLPMISLFIGKSIFEYLKLLRDQSI